MQEYFPTPSFALDHIAVAAGSLAEGVAHVREALGVDMPAGGGHPEMGTHNHLLRLGDGLFLEVIAIDPDAAAPTRPRWFALDRLGAAAPLLATWVLRAVDFDSALASGPEGTGKAIRVSRGGLSWRIAVPDDGSMPFGGAYPTLIEWPPGPHPASRMPDLGCALEHLKIEHPDAAAIRNHLDPKFEDARVDIAIGPQPRLVARIATPHGARILA